MYEKWKYNYNYSKVIVLEIIYSKLTRNLVVAYWFNLVFEDLSISHVS